MSDFWHKTAKVAHGLGMIADTLSGRPHFDRHIGLRNWFHAQWRLPRRPQPLPPFYQARYDRFANRLMAHSHHGPAPRRTHMATPPFRHGHGRA